MRSTLRLHSATDALDGRIVLGIDPGTRRTGFAVLRAWAGRLESLGLGVIELPREWPLVRRLAQLGDAMGELVQAHRPDEVSMEQAIYAQNPRTALVLGQARGVLVYAAARAGLAIHEYSPREVKRAVSGNGNASKEQVQGMVGRLLGLSRPPVSDAADAAAMALCHLLRPVGPRRDATNGGRPARAARRSSRWTEADVLRVLGGGGIR